MLFQLPTPSIWKVVACGSMFENHWFKGQFCFGQKGWPYLVAYLFKGKQKAKMNQLNSLCKTEWLKISARFFVVVFFDF